MGYRYYSFEPVNSSIWNPLTLRNVHKSVQFQFERASGSHLGQIHRLVFSTLCYHRRRDGIRLVASATIEFNISHLVIGLFLCRCGNCLLFPLEIHAAGPVDKSNSSNFAFLIPL